MRLAIVAGPAWAPTADRTADRRVADQATALARSGQDVRIFVPAGRGLPAERGGDWSEPDVPVEAVPTTGAADPSSAAASFGSALAGAWRHWQPELVHAHRCWGGLAAVSAAGDRALPVALTFHEADSPDPLAQEQPGGWHRRLGHAVDRVIAQTRAETDALVRLGVSRQRITMVPAGVDARVFAPDGPRADRDRPGPRVLVVDGDGGREGSRGIADTVRALSRVPAAELVVVAGNGDGSDDVPERLAELASRCGVADRVRRVGRAQPDQLAAWYRSADLVVCPWHGEPSGATVLEAMACGVPVVATAAGGHRDAVVDGLTGVLVPPGNPTGLGQAVRAVLGDPVRRMAYAAAARDRAQQCYAWDRVVRFLSSAYRQLRPAPEPAGEPDSAEVTRTASA